MQELLTLKEYAKALYLCASKEKTRTYLNGIFKDGEIVYSTDGRRLVIIKHDSFKILEDGFYTFSIKPIYTKNFSTLCLEKQKEASSPDIKSVQFEGVKVLTHDLNDSSMNLSKLIINIFDKCATSLDINQLDFLPLNYRVDIYKKQHETTLEDNKIEKYFKSSDAVKFNIDGFMTAYVMPFRNEID